LFGEVHQLVRVLTDEPFLVITGNVMPYRAICIEVVQHGNASLVMLPLNLKLPIIRLGVSSAAGLAPCSGDLSIPTSEPHIGARPEPSVDNCGLQVGTVATLKVAFPARGPEEANKAVDHSPLQELILFPSLNADEVHAVATANISPGDPVNLEVFCQLILPAKEIVVSVVLRVFDPVCTILWVGEAKSSSGCVPILSERPADQA